MSPNSDRLPVSFVGHPFAPIGKGEELRANARALLSLDEPVEFVDVYCAAERHDPGHLQLVGPREVRRLPPGKRIFHINGDEVDPVLRRLEATGSRFEAGYNIVMPAWELPIFPEIWIEQLRRFDEVWAISSFVAESLAASGVRSHNIGQSVDIAIRPFLSRQYFGIRESAYVFLTFMDFSSYAARKNPRAVIEMFRQLVVERPFDDIQLVLKVKGDKQLVDAFEVEIDLPRGSFVSVNRLLSTYEQHSLIAACDCLVSLHRAEGFGRGPAEAMRLGRLALATGWSGNLDFMNEDNSMLASYELRAVAADEYVEWRGQHWAEPDVEHAIRLARSAVDQPEKAKRRARKGHDDVIRLMGNRAVGLRMLDRLTAT